MIIAVAIITGFKDEIEKKVIGFGGHFSIVNYDSNSSYETAPVSKNQPFYPGIEDKEGVRSVQVYGIKAGIVKTKEEMHGVILKGVGRGYDWGFFRDNIVKGRVLQLPEGEKSNGVLVSRSMARLLQLDTADHIIMYFIQQPPRVRKFRIVGIYDTGLAEYDSRYMIGDLRHIQKLNNWRDDQVTGFEVFIDDFDELQAMYPVIYDEAGSYFTEDNNRLKIQTIWDVNSQIHEWLRLTDVNVWVILGLMIIVASFNMISGLLIMILERSFMIGLLKSLGYPNWSVRKVFLYYAAYLTAVGLLIGNLIGLSLCVLQQQTGIVALDPASYYVSYVPVKLMFSHVLLLNLGTLVITVAVLVIPSYLITRISPARALKFE